MGIQEMQRLKLLERKVAELERLVQSLELSLERLESGRKRPRKDEVANG